MNERIKQLAEQAEGTKKHVPSVWQFYDHELEKFAELIVKECVEQGKQIQLQTVSNGSKDYVDGRKMGIEVFMNQIKKHFGVEE